MTIPEAIEAKAEVSARQHNILQLVAQGCLAEAQTQAESLLEDFPCRADIWNLLGNVYALNGDRDAAISSYAKSKEFDPNSLDPLINLASIYHEMGLNKEAMKFAKQALRMDEKCIEAKYRLALIARSDGKDHIALSYLNSILYEKHRFIPALIERAKLLTIKGEVLNAFRDINLAINIDQNNYEIYMIRAELFAISGHLAAAEIDFETALKLNSSDYISYLGYIKILIQQNKADTALEIIDKAAKFANSTIDHFFTIGTLYLEIKQYEEAKKFFQKVLDEDCDHAPTLNNYGSVLKNIGQYEAALTQYQRLFTLLPADAKVSYNIAAVYFELKDYHLAIKYADHTIKNDHKYIIAYQIKGLSFFELMEYQSAIKAFSEAIDINPEEPESYLNLGHVYRITHNYKKAVECYKKALEFRSRHKYLRGDLLLSKLQICDWSNIEVDIQSLLSGLEQGTSLASPFVLLSISNDASILLEAARLYASQNYPKKKDIDPIDIHRHKKIKIGYYSADFFNHATMHLMAGLFELHDRNKFELYAFSFGPQVNDEMRLRAENSFDHFIEVNDLSDKAIALVSRHFEIDIAVDLKGYTAHSRPNIFAYRAAPVQINYLGFPGTMGADFVDYIIADPILIPDGHEKFYHEKVLKLPNCYQVNDSKRFIDLSSISRRELNLPEDKFIFCSFNNNFKIMPNIFNLWVKILKETPNSIFWIFADNKDAQKNLLKEFHKSGIDEDRIIFAERVSPHMHLLRQSCADLMLDTFPCNAHTTASDALFVGLPLITLEGSTFASRVSSSILTAVGLPDFVSRSEAEYMAKAVYFGKNPGKCRAISNYLLNTVRLSPLFNTEQTTRDLEALYLKAFNEKSAQ